MRMPRGVALVATEHRLSPNRTLSPIIIAVDFPRPWA